MREKYPRTHHAHLERAYSGLARAFVRDLKKMARQGDPGACSLLEPLHRDPQGKPNITLKRPFDATLLFIMGTKGYQQSGNSLGNLDRRRAFRVLSRFTKERRSKKKPKRGILIKF